MAYNFAAISFQQAQEFFGALKKDLAKQSEAQSFVAGDDWRDGKNWTGASFDGNDSINSFLKKEISKKFTAKGTIKSVSRRHRRGVVGKIPTWQIVSRSAPADPDAPIPKEIEELIGEAQKILNEFWKNSRVHRTVKQLVNDYLAVNRGLLRLFFVQNADDENAVEIAESTEEAVKLIHLFREKPEQGIVVFDKETLRKSSFFRYEKGGRTFIEQCYIENGLTVFRTLEGDDYLQQKAAAVVSPYLKPESQEETDEPRLPLGGKLLVFEIQGIDDSSFITPAMCSQQKLQNKAATVLSHVMDSDGFRSTIIANGLPPGEWQQKPGSSEPIYVPFEKGFKFGPGEVQFVNGLPTIEKNNEKGTTKTSVTTPNVHQSEPVGISTYTEAIQESGNAILEDADQKHIGISNDSELSGEARRQAREDYAGSLEDTKSDLDDVMSEVFEAVLALVAYLMNQPDRYIELQVVFSAILNAGPVSVEDRVQATSEGDAGYRTKESAMELIGISDPDAMAAAVKKQQEENPGPTDDPNKPKKDPKTGEK